ncbi:MAG: cohesin domain-containing protein [Candidatus Bathyarchaeia archaeon]
MKHGNPSKILAASTLLAILALFCFSQMAESLTPLPTVVSVEPQASTARVAETLTVNISISNVENLYGLDVTLSWNNSILQVLSSVSTLGVESHPGGVLHEAAGAPISFVEDTASQETGEYHVVATSQSPADSFNGTGTIATLTFNVTRVGRSPLTLYSELANHPPPDETAVFIEHQDVGGSVDVVIPEFPTAAALVVLVVAATAVLLLSKRRLRKTSASLVERGR